MKDANIARASAARSRTQRTLERTERNDASFFREKRKNEAANLEKTLRLRELRRARDLAEREAAPPTLPAKSVRKRIRSTVPKVATGD